MSDLELSEAWNVLDRDSHAILSTAKSILNRGEALTEREVEEIIINLCRIQDLVITLEKDNGYYPEISILAEFLRVGEEAYKKFPRAAFSDILKVTLRRIKSYLQTIKYYDHIEKQKHEGYDKKKIKKPETYQEKLSRYEMILFEESQKLLNKTRAELSRQKQVLDLPKEKTILELSQEKDRSLQKMVRETANLMILTHYREKYRV